MRALRAMAWLMLMAAWCSARGSDLAAQNRLAEALRGTNASAVVLDWRTGLVVARVGEDARATPGSVVKPLLLEWALRHGVVRPTMTVYCRRNLRIGARELRCTHPADQPVIDAEMAVAESCNTWFAELGKRFTNAGLGEALDAAGLRHGPMGDATVEQRELTVLGLEGVTVTPLELAKAYRATLLAMTPDDAVGRGMRDSVRFGMARGAAVAGVELMGKTGTANALGQAATHGWFAGAVPGKYVVVIYVPRGDGGVASGLARRFVEASR